MKTQYFTSIMYKRTNIRMKQRECSLNIQMIFFHFFWQIRCTFLAFVAIEFCTNEFNIDNVKVSEHINNIKFNDSMPSDTKHIRIAGKQR